MGEIILVFLSTKFLVERRQLAKARSGHIMIGDKKVDVFGIFGLKFF